MRSPGENIQQCNVTGWVVVETRSEKFSLSSLSFSWDLNEEKKSDVGGCVGRDLDSRECPVQRPQGWGEPVLFEELRKVLVAEAQWPRAEE